MLKTEQIVENKNESKKMEKNSFLYRHASVFLFRGGPKMHFSSFDKGADWEENQYA